MVALHLRISIFRNMICVKVVILFDLSFGIKSSFKKKVEIPGTEGRAGMVAIPDPDRKVDVEKVIIIVIVVVVIIIIISTIIIVTIITITIIINIIIIIAVV